MPLPDRSGDAAALGQIEECFAALNRLAGERGTAAPASDSVLASDNVAMPREAQIQEWAWMLLQAAIDHAHAFSRLSGEAGLHEWHAHAPWTLMRAGLESASQLIWLIGPDDQQVRFERLLTLVRDDYRQWVNASELRSTVEHHDQVKAEFERIKAYVETFGDEAARKRIAFGVPLLDCIKYAAGKSSVIDPNLAVYFWRAASGYAHGRPWAHLNLNAVREIARLPDDTSVVVDMIDYKNVSHMLAVTTGTIQYAAALLAHRSGLRATIKQIIRVQFTPNTTL